LQAGRQVAFGPAKGVLEAVRKAHTGGVGAPLAAVSANHGPTVQAPELKTGVAA